MSLIVVGSVALDTVITPKGKRENAVGGSATFFSLAAERLTRVKMVGVVGEDFPQSAIAEFGKRNIDLKGLEIRKGKTFRWGGIYRENMKERETLFTELNVFKDFSPDLPADYRKSDFLFLGNIHPALQLRVLDQMEGKPLVGLDTMNLWISTCREQLIEAVSRSHIIIINDEEIIQLTGRTAIPEAVKMIHDLGPGTVIVKKGKFGAGIYFQDEKIEYPICPEKELIDPTGAGDAFAGGFMGYLASRNTLELSYDDYYEAMNYGTVMASYLVESFSTDTLAAVTKEQINRRIETYRRICIPGYR